VIDGGSSDSGQGKPTTIENEHKCSILAVVGEVIGVGSNGGQRKPRTAKNECEHSISSIVICRGGG